MSLISDREVESELQSQLLSGERFLWAGRPKTGILLRSSDVFLIPFSLLWGGFAIFWESTVLMSGAPGFFAIWGIPFVVIGLYFIFGRFLTDAQMRGNTRYGITADRIIIRSGLFSPSVSSLNIRTLSDITFEEKSDGSGTILFGPADPRSSMMNGMQWPGVKQPAQLQFIQEVRQVYELIVKSQQSK